MKMWKFLHRMAISRSRALSQRFPGHPEHQQPAAFSVVGRISLEKVTFSVLTLFFRVAIV